MTVIEYYHGDSGLEDRQKQADTHLCECTPTVD